MYEAVDAENAAAADALVAAAARLGYDGLVVRGAEASSDDAAVDIVPAVTVDADPEAAGSLVRDRRAAATLLLVRGGTRARNRFATGEPRVDVLVGAVGPDGFPFDDVLARAAARAGVRVAFDLGPVLRETGGTRVRAISALARLHDLVETNDTPHVVTAGADVPVGLRAPRALAAVGTAVGLPDGFVREGLREWGRLVARNRDRARDDWVMPGVRRGRYDPADWSGPEGDP